MIHFNTIFILGCLMDKVTKGYETAEQQKDVVRV
jgi:hypothetical protein